MCWIEFGQFDSFRVPTEMPLGYVILLVMYVLRNNMKRWLKREQRKRRGELFFYVWWLTWLIMLAVSFATNAEYGVPKRMLETCLSISVPFVANFLSKFIHESRRPATKK